MDSRIPEPTVRRLSAYMRKLEDLAAAGREHVSSRELAEHISTSPHMVRRDLAMFGQFGKPGKGYGVGDLRSTLRVILGTQQQWKVVVVGAGRLGQALLGYPYFSQRAFDLFAVFDVDPEKVGTEAAGISVRPMDELEEVIERYNVRLAVLAVPPDAAQDVAQRLMAAGIQGILNFSSVTMDALDGVFVLPVDIS